MQKRAEKFLADIKTNYESDESKIPDSAKKDFEKIQNEVKRLSDELNEIIKGTLSSDDPKVAERLFNELPLTEIRRLISTALGKEANAEA